MKCQRAEQMILLRDAGELDGWRRRRLERHLAACAACCAYADELRAVTAVVRAWQAGEPSASTLAAIREAGRGDEDRRAEFVFRPSVQPSWRPVAVYATLLVVVLGGLLWLRSAQRAAEPALAQREAPPESTVAATAWDDGVDAEIDALSELLASALDDKNGVTATSADESDEDAIARELLNLQGYSI